MTSQSWSNLWWLTAAVSHRLRWGCVVAIGCSWMPAIVHSAEPGQALEIVLTVPPGRDSVPPLRLRYCPTGTIRPGRTSSDDSASLPQPEQVAAFYIGETEVTLAQLCAIFPEALADISALARKTTAKPELVVAAQRSGDEPAFYLSPRHAIEFCRRLQARADADRLKADPPSVERQLLRLPSHVEWQYAARALQDCEQQPSRPHFARWIKLTDLSPSNQQKCHEVWSALGKGELCPDTQDAFLMMSSTTDPSARVKVRSILDEAFATAFGASERSAGGTGRLEPAGAGRANDWGLHGLHGGVSEYALWARETGRARSLWARLSERVATGDTLETVDDLFLCGGSFADSYDGADALARFTVWGGPKLANGQPQSLTIAADDVFDLMPGFRILLERDLAPDWMVLVRRATYRHDLPLAARAEYLARNAELARTLVPEAHAALVAFRFYRTLQNVSKVGTPLSPTVPINLADALRGSKPPGGSNSKLRALLESSAPTTTPNRSPSADEAFFRSVALAMEPSTPTRNDTDR